MSKLTKFIYASDNHGDMADPQALAALFEFTKDFKPDIRIAGGSARHRALQAALARRTGATVRTTAESDGIPVHMREAAEIAILGALADDGVRYSLPQVTGAASVVPESAVLEAAAGNAVSSERTQV